MRPSLPRRRYLRVDPDNRLVADSLEADWNDKLRLLAEAQEAMRTPARTRIASSSMSNSAQRSFRWPRTFRGSGAIPPRPIANGNA